MWDISNTTTWIVGQSHAQLRRELPPLVAAAGSRPPTSWATSELQRRFFTGNPVADFLLGYYARRHRLPARGVSASRARSGNPRRVQLQYLAPYIQDDWKVNSKLTLNLGLRYDYRSVPYETNDHMAWRNLNYAPGGLLVADQTLATEGIVDGALLPGSRAAAIPTTPTGTRSSLPASASPTVPTDDGKTVIRGGYGIFYDSAEGREIDGAADIYPYVSRGNYTQTLGQTAPLQTTDQLFPSFADRRRGDAGRQHLPRREPVAGAEEPLRPAVVSRRPARAVRPATIAELNYVGEQGHQPVDAASTSPRPSPTRRTTRPSPAASRSPTSPSTSTATGAATRTTTRLNAKLEHRGRGLLATVAYTWAKSTDSKSAAAGIGATRVQRLAGVPRQPRPGARPRPLRTSTWTTALVGELRLEPALRQGRAVRRRRHPA